MPNLDDEQWDAAWEAMEREEGADEEYTDFSHVDGMDDDDTDEYEDDEEDEGGEVSGGVNEMEFTWALAEPLIEAGGWTVSLPGEAPLIQPAELPLGKVLTVFTDKQALETFLRQHRDLFKESATGELQAQFWSKSAVMYLFDVAFLDETHAAVYTAGGPAEVVDPLLVLDMFIGEGAKFRHFDERPAPLPPASSTFNVEYGPVGPLFRQEV